MMGPGTGVVAGERFPLQMRAAWAPVAFGPSAQVAPLPQVSIPPVVGAPGAAVSNGGAMPGAGNIGAAAAAASAPFNMKVSPVLWAVLFLVVGLVGMRVIHWR